ncbi:MAG TPA: metallophosphoesterase [Bdellovibrionales bacterium]|nr:metallophosphoesterase [Bdellovibrionales bacterium]
MLKSASIVWLIVMLAAFAHAEPRITILHTSDLHSHFTNRQSPRKLGGYARVKSKIDELRKSNPNSLLLDAGDWSEGNIFFTLNSGEASQRMLEAFGYDAIVLGNHDWLVGPEELYDAFRSSGMSVPVLSANMDFSKLPKNIPLENHIKPYVIKHVAGKKIAILGLSTFQIIFDHFFRPAKPLDPIRPARRLVKYLREVEKADVVIALTHLGQETDAVLARLVPGLDLIVGGHSHVLYKKPRYVNGVPIVHVGLWGQHVGEYQLSIDLQGKVSLVDHMIHQVDEGTPENKQIRELTQGFESAVEQAFGSQVFKDNIVTTEVGLRTVKKDPFSNDILGHWAVDAIREATDAEVAFDSPMFASTQLFPGTVSTADIFNVYPHIYSKTNKDSWTIHTYEVRGIVLRMLVSVLLKAGVSFKISGGEIIVDARTGYNVRSFKIGGLEVEYFRLYKVASTRGILDVFRELRQWGLSLGPTEWKDTGKVMWREVARKLTSLTPITREKLQWEGRIRTVQPDLALNKEFIEIKQAGEKLHIKLRVLNGGLRRAGIPKLRVFADATPLNSVDDRWELLPMQAKIFQNQSRVSIQPGEWMDFEAVVPLRSQWKGVFVPIIANIEPVLGEVSQANNTVTNDVEYLPAVMAGNDEGTPGQTPQNP